MSHVSRETVRARSYELDSYGHVNNAVYLQWLEHARSQLLQERGFNYNNIEQHWGVRLVLVSTSIQFRAGIRLNDEVEISTRVKRMGTTSVTFEQVLRRLEGNGRASLVAECETVIVFTDPTLKIPQPIPARFKELYGEGAGPPNA